MNAKKFVLFSMLLVAVSLQALGQQRGESQRRGEGQRGRPGNERMVEAMKERLDLSDDQVTKLKEIYKKSADEFRKLREETAEENHDRREEFRKLRNKQQEEVSTLLTEEQLKELKKWREERQSQRRRPRPKPENHNE